MTVIYHKLTCTYLCKHSQK